jgi:hypothetical protein
MKKFLLIFLLIGGGIFLNIGIVKALDVIFQQFTTTNNSVNSTRNIGIKILNTQKFNNLSRIDYYGRPAVYGATTLRICIIDHAPTNAYESCSSAISEVYSWDITGMTSSAWRNDITAGGKFSNCFNDDEDYYLLIEGNTVDHIFAYNYLNGVPITDYCRSGTCNQPRNFIYKFYYDDEKDCNLEVKPITTTERFLIMIIAIIISVGILLWILTLLA